MEKSVKIVYKGITFFVRENSNIITISTSNKFIPETQGYGNLWFKRMFETYPIIDDKIAFSKKLRYDYSDRDLEKFVSSDMIKTILDKTFKYNKSFLLNIKKIIIKEIDTIDQYLKNHI